MSVLGLRIRPRTEETLENGQVVPMAPAMVEDTTTPVWIVMKAYKKRWDVTMIARAFGLSPYLASEALEYAHANPESIEQDELDTRDGAFEWNAAQKLLGAALAESKKKRKPPRA